jgi:hypothetical protein
MGVFADQVKHNESLLAHLDAEFPNKYFDWKVTLVFYCSIHLVKELGLISKKIIGESHFDILNNINPNPRVGFTPTLSVSKTQYNFYNDIYQYSRVARYTGITDYTIFEAQRKADYNICKTNYAKMKQYYIQRGVVI